MTDLERIQRALLMVDLWRGIRAAADTAWLLPADVWDPLFGAQMEFERAVSRLCVNPDGSDDPELRRVARQHTPGRNIDPSATLTALLKRLTQAEGGAGRWEPSAHDKRKAKRKARRK